MNIVSVIVTRNRLNLLQRCIEFIRNQTRKPDKIIVINNDSTDGTGEWLDEQTDIIHIRNPNTGGAGGFHRGIEEGMKLGADWLWLMDDDGYPDPDQLKLLEKRIGTKPASAWNAEVVSIQNPQEYAFGMLRMRKDMKPWLGKPIRERKKFESFWEADGIYPGGTFFNGSLISVEAIRKIGNVDSSMFIWGDDVDFHWRLFHYAPVYTVRDATHFHPRLHDKEIPLWKLYFGLRNFIRNHNRYYPLAWIRNFRFILVFGYRMSKYKKGIYYFYYAIKRGLSGNFEEDIASPF